MADNFKTISDLDISFKEFMPGQVIQSAQFNDDMRDIEEKVNEVIGEHNKVSTTVVGHLNNVDNPHEVTAHQVGTYNVDEIDGLIEEIKDGHLYDNAISNRVLGDGCVDNRTIKDKTITVIKVEDDFGNQIDISGNVDIVDRYTKNEVDELVRSKVGEGAYTKEEIDEKFQDIQAGQIIDKTISADKVTSDFGDNIDISNNPSIVSRYTKGEVDMLISMNGLPKDWGNITEQVDVDTGTGTGSLPVAGHMVAGRFISPSTSVLDIDVKENVEARGEYSSVKERLDAVDSQIKDIVAINLNNYDGTDTEKVKKMFEDIETNYRDSFINIIVPYGEYLITEKIIVKNIKNKKIDFIGELIFDNCDGIEFLNIENSEINISSIVGDSNISISNLDSQNYNGVKIINSNTNNFNLKSIVGFENGIILHGQDFSDSIVRGSYNNTINFKKIYCTNAITISDDNVGWVNENIFRGGALFCKNGIISGSESNTEQSSARFHGNKFENIEFESVYGGNGITFYQARSNIVTYPRFESMLENASYIIYEGNSACMNRYVTARYLLPIDKIHLNVKGLCGSILEGDLRGSTSRAGDIMVSVANEDGARDGKIVYKSDYLGGDCPKNSIINMYNDSYLFKYIDNNNVAKNLLYYEDKIIIETDNLLNNFQNYSDDNGSEYDKFNYRLCGNGEVMISGTIKGGTNNGKIYNLPEKYKPKKIHTFPVYGKNSVDGNKTYFIEIYPSGGVYLIGQVSNLTYLFLDGIRFSIN